MKMSLVDWHKRGIVQKHAASSQEILALLAVADRELADAGVAGVSADGRFRAAYNAVLSLAAAALHAEGYRTPGNVAGHHARTLQSLALTLGIEDALADQLDVCRKKRNISTYDVAGAISEEEVKALLQIAQRSRVIYLGRDAHSVIWSGLDFIQFEQCGLRFLQRVGRWKEQPRRLACDEFAQLNCFPAGGERLGRDAPTPSRGFGKASRRASAKPRITCRAQVAASSRATRRCTSSRRACARHRSRRCRDDPVCPRVP
jgi:hypothetical protein